MSCNKRKWFNILVKPTNDCNINCKYCFDKKMREKLHGTRMKVEDIEHIVNLSADLSDEVAFIWHGGEATLMGKEFFEEVQEYFFNRYDTEFEQTMQSNGLNIIKDRSWLNTLIDNDIQLGVSYDILSQDVRTTASDSYSEFIKEQVKLDNISGALTVVNRNNIDKLIEMYEFAKQNLGSNYYMCYNPVFKTEDTKEEGMEISPQLIAEHYPKFIEHILTDTSNSALRERTTIDFLSVLVGNRTNLTCSYTDCRGDWLCVVANGDMYPCDRAIEKYNLGNVKDCNDLNDVFESVKFQEYVSDVDYRLKTYCEKCSYYEYCGGGCNSRHAYSGDISSSANLNEQLCVEFKVQFNSVWKVFQKIKTRSDVNPYYLRILDDCEVLLPSEIEEYLTFKEGIPISLNSEEEDLLNFNFVESPQFRLFKIFNNKDYKTFKDSASRCEKVFENHYEDIRVLLNSLI